ncbi:MAG: 4Fe-4S dicluster domain-containing protein [Bacillota bacterium]|nr:4Fe-4S dicluster domain-containing protein [Bacillota bacterium]
MKRKIRYTLLIDLDKCVGCMSCTIACKNENNVDPGIFWNRVYKVGPEGQFPNLDMFYFPKQCMHCNDPLCIKVCPTKATYKTEEGIVLVDHDKCYGCGYCTWACPYGARTKNEKKGMVEKCILCAHLVERGEKPACVVSCVGNCRVFGDINDPTSEISIYLAEHSDSAFQIHPEIGTKPSVIYLKPRKGAAKLCQSNTR